MIGLSTLVLAILTSPWFTHVGSLEHPGRWSDLQGASWLSERSQGTEEFMEKRQSSNGRCGTGFGTICANDECCSSAGWCGNGYLYCSAPACQIDYGPACDANIRPTGPDTINIARPKVGSIPYGQAIYDCEVNGGIALTYDDGPYTYTEDLLNLLDEYNAKATFFITGRNLGKEAINDPATPWPNLIKRMINSGHQIGSHTWSHQRLTQLSKPKFWNQMIYNEIALSDILGYFPTYMRPPYSASNTTTDAWLGELGYHITYFNLDTEGYLHDSPSLIDTSKEIWDNAVQGKDPKTTTWLDIEHDPVYQSVYNLTEYMLKSLNHNGFKTVTVGECLGDPKDNWYRMIDDQSNPTTTVDPPLSQTSLSSSTGTFPPTTDGRCGSHQGGATCLHEPDGETCCSQYGWCGSTVDHCGRGCQPIFGTLSQIQPRRLSARTADAGQSMAARLASRSQGQLAAHSPDGVVPQWITVALDVSQALEPADLQRR
ncbi:family 4 carbohydrate esterase [Fusarium oxysporum]|nr:family 4 carbohydrate esterase [Fusarium oxysporum]